MCNHDCRKGLSHHETALFCGVLPKGICIFSENEYNIPQPAGGLALSHRFINEEHDAVYIS